ncbi:hypothetical protein B0I35DRAFT_151123 [Stachybotrys elegans]|uniref:Ubiquitin-like protease family profile domain-containing protein n=1 Tax=Stachybotrys elegans TaxID=80388 RepID=A0A8K0SF32_9HYPO|nr:hypothetical protein B0I35DRAFT_151123 [Stachybotrys elegans]
MTSGRRDTMSSAREESLTAPEPLYNQTSQTHDRERYGNAPSPYQNDLRQAEPTARSLATRLRVPIILDSILRARDEAEKLSAEIRLALAPLSSPDKRHVRSFAYSLCRNCDLLDTGLDEAVEKTRINCEQSDKGLDETNGVAQCDIGSRCGIEDCDMELKDSDRISSARPSQNDDRADTPPTPSVCQRAGGRHSPTIQAEGLNERFHGASCTAASPANISSDENLNGGWVDSVTSASTQGSTLVASPSNITASIEAMTPEATPSPTGLRGSSKQMDDCEQGCAFLINQDIDDFIDESYDQIRSFSLPGNSAETYKALFNSLTNKLQKDTTGWSDGSQWISLLEAGHSERDKGSIRYALTAIAFSQWHASQVQIMRGVPESTAAKEVSGRILRPKPADNAATKKWEQRRKSLSTHLTRGRKWSLLVTELGSGILLKNAWRLAKSPESALRNLIKQLQGAPKKMAVLKLLTDQMTLFMETGRTDQTKFRHDMEKEGLPSLELDLVDTRFELGELLQQVQGSSTDRLLVKSTNYSFGIDSLRRLGARRWLNDEVILACLHLSDRLDYVRVGFSIPLHQQSQPQNPVLRPFERAAKLIAEWHYETETTGPLVCFFPLFQRQNHFSLLEINERDMRLYHYDSMSQGDNAVVKAACEKEFPQFRYVEESALQQEDGHSCGLFTIKHARHRMLGRHAASGSGNGYDSSTLRSAVVGLFRSAWESEALVAAPRLQRKRKLDRSSQPSGGERGTRKRLRD